MAEAARQAQREALAAEALRAAQDAERSESVIFAQRRGGSQGLSFNTVCYTTITLKYIHLYPFTLLYPFV